MSIGIDKEVQNEAYSELRIAVIKQAIKDFRFALWSRKRNPSDPESNALLQDTIDFFNSEWFSFLSGAACGQILQELYP